MGGGCLCVKGGGGEEGEDERGKNKIRNNKKEDLAIL